MRTISTTRLVVATYTPKPDRDPWWATQAILLEARSGCRVAYLEDESSFPDYAGLMTADRRMWRYACEVDGLVEVEDEDRAGYSVVREKA